MPTNQDGSPQGNSSSLAYQKPPFQGADNAPWGPPLPQPHVAQSYLPPGYNELDKVHNNVNDVERMTRDKESNERMMKTTSEQFAQFAMSNREKRVFPSQP